MLLGSLFDGIGGFPLAAQRHEITPVWACEIEKFPIEVTKKHFPDMKHLGDITQINGAEIEPVDIITFGSPCQDLSIAGKREGLEGARSGLFMDAVRIIREMRTATDGRFPRFAVWENVPGAYSSNKGEDFRAVLEEIAEAEIPMPPSGKWATAGMVRTERIDIAWRTLDAQYWGVPQRRKRIFLVADFNGQCAGEILFKPSRLSWNFAESREAGQEAAGNVGKGFKEPVYGLDLSKKIEAIGMQEEVAPTLTIGTHAGHCNHVLSNRTTNNICGCLSQGAHPGGFNGQDAYSHQLIIEMTSTKNTIIEDGICPTLTARMGTGGNQVNAVLQPCAISLSSKQQSLVTSEDIANTLGANDYKKPQAIAYSIAAGNTIDRQLHNGGNGKGVNKEVSFALNTIDRHAVAFTPSSFGNYQEGVGTLRANGGDLGGGSETLVKTYAVRRLTPTECLRLQGFPDWWLDDVPGYSDTQAYKAVGNSVAIPCVEFVIGRVKEVC